MRRPSGSYGLRLPPGHCGMRLPERATERSRRCRPASASRRSPGVSRPRPACVWSACASIPPGSLRRSPARAGWPDSRRGRRCWSRPSSVRPPRSPCGPGRSHATSRASAAPEHARSTFRRKGTVRFVWQADPDGRFTRVSPALEEVVGPAAGRIVGRTFADLTRNRGAGPDGVADLFTRRETLSGRTLLWSVDGTDLEVPVDWAGMPVYGAQRELIGFRGFGLLRTEAAQARAVPSDGGAAGEPAPADPEETPGTEDREVATEATPPALAQRESEAPHEGTWFADIRERVAATLSGARAAVRSGEERTRRSIGPSRGPDAPRLRRDCRTRNAVPSARSRGRWAPGSRTIPQARPRTATSRPRPPPPDLRRPSASSTGCPWASPSIAASASSSPTGSCSISSITTTSARSRPRAASCGSSGAARPCCARTRAARRSRSRRGTARASPSRCACRRWSGRACRRA